MKNFNVKTFSFLLAILLFSGVKGFSQCSAAFTWAEQSGVVTFTNTSVGVNTFLGAYGLWSFGDGSSGTSTGLSSISHTYNSNGAYTVCLTIADSAGCSSTWCDSIYVQNAGGSGTCSSLFSYITDTCEITFTDASTASAGVVAWYWSFGDGVNSALQNPVHIYNGPGPWNVTLTIVAADSCANTSSQWINTPLCMNSQPPCSASYYWVHDSTGAYTILLYNTSNASLLASYFWDFGDGSSSTLAYPSHVYAGIGTYTVCVTIADSGCTSTYCDSIAVTYKNLTAFSINVVSTATNSVKEESLTNMIVYPNPFKNELNVQIGLTETTNISFDLIDLSGRTVFTQKTADAQAGKFTANLKPTELSSGIYLLKITTGDKSFFRKVMMN